jgi:very-short-patch-repair endonuclease
MTLITTGFHVRYNPKLKERARELRKNMTLVETKLWLQFLRTHPSKFLRQKPLDNYIVDFYCANSRLVIEIDGDSHFTDQSREYDKTRTKSLEKYGLKVLRFTNLELLNNFDGACEEIEKNVKLRGVNPPSPLR